MSAHAVPIEASSSVIEQLLTRENRLTTSIILCRLVQKLSEVVNVRLQPGDAVEELVVALVLAAKVLRLEGRFAHGEMVSFLAAAALPRR